MATKGIDVSHYQGKIDWKKVKASGIDFAILRAGWSWYGGGLSVDKNFVEYIEGAQAAGLDTGVYVYSYDHSPEAARIAARRVLELVRIYPLTYPVAFDMEYEAFNLSAGKAVNTAICEAFLSTIQEAGYYAALYASTDFLNNYLDMSKLSNYDVWAADYRDTCGYKGSHGMWQYGVVGATGRQGKDYTIRGSIPGISANVDVDLAYKDYPGIIRAAGLNGFGVPEPPKEPEEDVEPSVWETRYHDERAAREAAEKLADEIARERDAAQADALDQRQMAQEAQSATKAILKELETIQRIYTLSR